MKYFVFFSTILLILYLVEFVKKDNRTFTFMDKDFTTAIKGFSILTVMWAHAGARLGVGSLPVLEWRYFLSVLAMGLKCHIKGMV